MKRVQRSLAVGAPLLQRASVDVTWEAWTRARADSVRPLIGTASVVSAGFAILVLSSFPPTRRFGLAVMGEALVDVLACLVVLPYLAAGSTFLRELFRRRDRSPAPEPAKLVARPHPTTEVTTWR